MEINRRGKNEKVKKTLFLLHTGADTPEKRFRDLCKRDQNFIDKEIPQLTLFPQNLKERLTVPNRFFSFKKRVNHRVYESPNNIRLPLGSIDAWLKAREYFRYCFFPKISRRLHKNGLEQMLLPPEVVVDTSRILPGPRRYRPRGNVVEANLGRQLARRLNQRVARLISA